VKRRTIAVILAVILALGAAGLVYWYTGSVKKQTVSQEATQTVLVAKDDIAAHTTGELTVQKSLTETRAVPESLVAPGALTDASALQGKVFISSVAKGQQIVTGQLGDPQEQSLSYEIKSGMRAVSIPMDRLRGVGGNPKAGDRVDVYATFKQDQLDQAGLAIEAILPGSLPAPGTQVAAPVAISTTAAQNTTSTTAGNNTTSTTGGLKSPVTKLLLQQVTVLAIDPMSDGGASTGLTGTKDETPSKPVIVLMVDPSDVERLVFAQEVGEIWLALVPAQDSAPVKTPGSVLTNVFK
jgi:pilus assembly protein CpaB